LHRQTPAPSSTPEHGLTTVPRILVVDDEPANVRLLERVLATAWTAEIAGVTDPRQAGERFDAFRPDLVLLDLHMPHIDGLTLLEMLLQRTSPDDPIPIIVLTADVSPEARRRSLELGATDLLTKPFDHTEILLRIRNVLRTRALHLRVRDHAADLDRMVGERTAKLNATIGELRRLDQQRRDLLGRLVDAEERDRMRLAAEINDDQIQHLAAVSMRLATLRGGLSANDEAAQALDLLQESVASATRRLRRLLFELRPPSLDRDGLRMAILEYARGEEREESQLVTVEDLLDQEPPGAVRAVVYRILHQALAISRRSGPNDHLRVSLRTKDAGVFARVSGVGESSGDALDSTDSMRERAELAGGWLKTRHADSGNTEIEFWIPA
jgi:DNA-binding response OmpR family regulator